jgi:hypothetical protein
MMTLIQRHAGTRALALALLTTALADASPQTAPSDGCLGETIRVSIEKHVHAKTNVRQTGGYQKGGFSMSTDLDISVHGVYVHALRDGELQWVKRSINWKGIYQQNMPECNGFIADAGGQLELGPVVGKTYSKSEATGSMGDALKWLHLAEKKYGNCFRVVAGAPQSLPFPDIRKSREQLRSGCCYSKVESDGTRYAETIEQNGNESLAMRVEHSEIIPNPSCTDKECSDVNPDEATSRLLVRATCDGQPMKDRQIGLRIDVEPRSGYHNHLGSPPQPRPRGRLNNGKNDVDCGGDTGAPLGNEDKACIIVLTDANGVAKATFKSPLIDPDQPDLHDAAKKGSYKIGIAGNYRITAKDARLNEVRAHVMVLAAVKGLQAATFSGNLVQGRGDAKDSSHHPNGSHGTVKTLQAFTALANKFVEAQGKHNAQLKACPGGPKPQWLPLKSLQVNDIALPDGGVFDLHLTGSSQHPATPWRPSHQTHNKGEGGDFNRFEAGEDNSGLNLDDVGAADCNGHTAIKQFWYAHTLLDLGTHFGHWDCSDLEGKVPPAANGPQQPLWNPALKVTFRLHHSPGSKWYCPQGDFSDPWYFPARLHLHVED